MGDGDDLGPAFEGASKLIHLQQPVVGHADPVDLGTGALGELLPGDDVGVVLHLGEHDPVAGRDVGVAPAAGDEVDRLGRVADEDHLAAVGCAEVVGDGRAGALECGGGLGREGVRAAVDVGVVAALVAVDRLDRGQDPLRAGAGVEVGDGLSVDLPRERRERLAHPFERKGPRPS